MYERPKISRTCALISQTMFLEIYLEIRRDRRARELGFLSWGADWGWWSFFHSSTR